MTRVERNQILEAEEADALSKINEAIKGRDLIMCRSHAEIGWLGAHYITTAGGRIIETKVDLDEFFQKYVIESN